MHTFTVFSVYEFTGQVAYHITYAYSDMYSVFLTVILFTNLELEQRLLVRPLQYA